MAPFGPTGKKTEWNTTEVPWFLPWMHELVGQGIPASRCTALVGGRGVGKMSLAYRFLLDGMLSGDNCMIISHQENRDAVVAGMRHVWRLKDSKIVKPVFGKHRDIAELLKKMVNPEPDNAKRLQDHGIGYLRVVYQAPVYVTPDEFFHRILFWIGQANIARAVLGPVDQWSSLFPQLAATPALIPAIVNTLDSHFITSLILGVSDDQPNSIHSGLLASSEFIVSLERRNMWWPCRGRYARFSNGLHEDGFTKGTPMATRPVSIGKRRKESGIIVQPVRLTRRGVFNGIGAITQLEIENCPGQFTFELTPLAPEYFEESGS